MLSAKDYKNFLDLIAKISTISFKSQSIDSLCAEAVSRIKKELQLEDCVIYLFDEKTQLLQQYSDKANKKTNATVLALGEGVVGTAAKYKRVENIYDSREVNYYIAEAKNHLSELAIPIYSEDRFLGILDSEHSDIGFFSENHETLFKVLAGLIASKLIAIEHNEQKSLEAAYYKEVVESPLLGLMDIDARPLYDFIQTEAKIFKIILNQAEKDKSELSKIFHLLKIRNVNKAAINFFNAETDEKLITEFLNLFTDETCLAFLNFLRAISEQKTSFEQSFSIKSLTSETLYIHFVVQIPQHKEDYKSLIFTFTNITTEREAVVELSDSEQRYKFLYDEAPNAYISVSAKTKKITRFNKKALELFSYSAQEMFSKTILELVKDSKEAQKKGMERVKRLKRGKEINGDIIEFLKSDGTVFWGKITVKPYFDIDGIVIESRSSIIDVSNEILANRALNEQKRTYEIMLDNVPLDLAIMDKDYRFIYLSKQAIRDKELREWMIGKTDFDYCKYRNISSKIAAERFKTLEKVKETKQQITWDEKLVKEGGETHYIIRSIYPVLDEKGRIQNFIGYGLNITQRKKFELELNSRKERLRIILESIGEAVIATDTNSVVTDMNLAAENLLGHTKKQTEGKRLANFIKILYRSSREHIKSPIKELVQTGKSTTILDSLILQTVDGAEYSILYNISPIFSEEKEIVGTVLVISDITEKVQLDLEVERSQRLESIGILAGGIAHDFNNLLTGIIGNMDLALSAVSKSDKKTINYIESTKKETLKATALSNQLLTFSKGGEPSKKTMRIESLIKESVKFALRGSSVKSYIKLDELPYIDVDEGQLTQVIQNITINAKQAMEGVGKFTVTASKDTIKRHAKLEDADYVIINFKDTGIGLSETEINKLFDPYFTTKDDGTGLGLATSFSILHRHNGYIDVQSELGEGTTFSIYLPVSKLQPKEENIREVDVEKTIDIKSVLVLDDEEVILDVVTTILDSMDIHAVKCLTGEDTLAAVKNDPNLKYFILDLTIRGGLGGYETLQTLKKINPNIKAIVSSGYSNDPIVANYKEHGFDGVISKPFTIADFKKSVIETFNL